MTTIIHTLEALSDQIAAWRGAGESIALVPTMGALHEGHMTLVEAAGQQAERVVVSIFVNPTQFGPNEDFNRYPRTFEADAALAGQHNVDAIWAPDVATMYPQGTSTRIEVAGVSEGLDGKFRPGHFSGVATVVAKLLLQVTPDFAFFGEKDYQQLCVIYRMTHDLDIPVDIIGVPTVREADGLALSSRNRYLSKEERAIAPKLQEGLRMVAKELPSNKEYERLFSNQRDAWLKQGFSKVDYLELRRAETLEPLSQYEPGARLLVAAWLGTTRLIDNIEV